MAGKTTSPGSARPGLECYRARELWQVPSALQASHPVCEESRKQNPSSLTVRSMHGQRSVHSSCSPVHSLRNPESELKSQALNTVHCAEREYTCDHGGKEAHCPAERSVPLSPKHVCCLWLISHFSSVLTFEAASQELGVVTVNP